MHEVRIRVLTPESSFFVLLWFFLCSNHFNTDLEITGFTARSPILQSFTLTVINFKAENHSTALFVKTCILHTNVKSQLHMFQWLKSTKSVCTGVYWTMCKSLSAKMRNQWSSLRNDEKCRAVTRLSFGVNINVKTNETGRVSCYSGVVTGTSKYVAPWWGTKRHVHAVRNKHLWLSITWFTYHFWKL